MNIKALFFGFLTLLTLPAFSVFPEMEVWGDGAHIRFLMKDFHTDHIDGVASSTQQEDLLWAVQECKPFGVFVLVEDSNSYCGANKKKHDAYSKYIPQTLKKEIEEAAEKHKEDIEISPLGCLINECRARGIISYNTECCQGLIALCHTSESSRAKKVTREEAITDLSEHAAQVAKNPLIKDMYASFVKKFNILKTTWKKRKNMEKFSEDFLSARSILVNMKTIHKLSEWNDAKYGFICEGASHIEEIKTSLTTLGYKKIQNFGNPSIWNELSIDEYTQQILWNALDLRKIFTQIFAQEKILKPVESLKCTAIKYPKADPTFLSSAQGQKYLAETRMADGNQTAAAPAPYRPALNGAAQASVSMMSDN